MSEKVAFEKQLSEMCISKTEDIIYIIFEENTGNKIYLPEYDVIYLSVNVTPKVLKNGLIKVFSEYRENLAESQKESYYNEPYFFEEVRKLILCLHNDKKKESVLVDYYKAIIDAFSKIHKSSPQLDPGFFQTMLYSLIIKIGDEEKLREILSYYNENKKEIFDNFPFYLLKDNLIIYGKREIKNFEMEYFEKQIMDPYIDLIKLLSLSDNKEIQELYSSLFLKDICGHIINDIYSYIENIDLSHIDLLVIDKIFSDDDLLLIKKRFPLNEGKFENLINDRLIERISDKKIFKLFVKSIFKELKSCSLRVGGYTNNSFDDDGFYLNLDSSEIDLLVEKANRFYNSQNKLNTVFMELGFHNGIEREKRMMSYLLVRKENAIVKEFSNNLISEENLVNRKRL